MPPELFNRTGDNWCGLFSIAEAAGGEWPERAKQAAMEEISEEDSNRALQLLEAIWQIFAEKKVVRMHTSALLQALVSVEEAPWKDANNGREIDGYWLREKLHAFLPQPANPEEAAALRRSREWREGKGPARKGYTENHLGEAWWRYIDRKTPSETLKADGAAANSPAHSGAEANGGGTPTSDQPSDAETKAGAGPAPDGGDASGVKNTLTEKGAHNGHGPARRRTRPSEAKPVGEA
jgi:hypothetical protein